MQGVLAQPRAGGLPPGTRFGRYACQLRLARGGMAELYLARHIDRPKLEKLFVVKRVLPHLAESDEFVAMFQNEARLASTLDHPNIAQVVDYGVAGDEHYLVMEYVHGRDARAILREATARGGFPRGCAIAIVSKVAAALHYAHERKDDDGEPLEIVHRDVSPSNVIVGYDGLVRLADFGIAKAVAKTRVTRTGTVKGKAGYMSPEQCRGEPVDRRSDVFGLGVLLYELTTLRRVFFAPSDLAIMSKVVAGDFKTPGEAIDDYPPRLQRVVMRALATRPEDRYPTALAFAEALDEFATAEELETTPAAVADSIQRLFGNPPYPAIDPESDQWLEEAPTTIAPPTAGLTVASVPPPPARSWRLPALAAGGLGVGGFFLGVWLAGSDSTAGPSAAPTGPAVESSVDSPAPEARPPDNASPADAEVPVIAQPDPQPEPSKPSEVEPESDPEPTKPAKTKPRKKPKRKKAPREAPSTAKKRKSFGPPQWGN